MDKSVSEDSVLSKDARLPDTFYLTDYAELKGWGCKVPQSELQQSLRNLSLSPAGLDCAIVETALGTLVQTTDFFYPLIDDPYEQGRIAAANVLSDLYALGIVECHSVLMLFGVGRNVPEIYRNTVTELLMRGFKGRNFI